MEREIFYGAFSTFDPVPSTSFEERRVSYDFLRHIFQEMGLQYTDTGRQVFLDFIGQRKISYHGKYEAADRPSPYAYVTILHASPTFHEADL